MSEPIQITEGTVFVQSGIPFTLEYTSDERGDPTIERWYIGANEESPTTDWGRFEIHVEEIIPTRTKGAIVAYRRKWFNPEGEQISRDRIKFGRLTSLRTIIRHRKMTPLSPPPQGTP